MYLCRLNRRDGPRCRHLFTSIGIMAFLPFCTIPKGPHQLRVYFCLLVLTASAKNEGRASELATPNAKWCLTPLLPPPPCLDARS